MIKAIIFDLDGVLIETEVRNVMIKKHTVEKYGVIWNRELSEKLAGMKFADVLDKVLSYLDDETRKKIHDEYYAVAYGGQISYRELESPNASELLKRLKAEGYKMALATNSAMDKITQVLKENQWEGIFDLIMDADSVTKKKPDPEVYLTAMARLDSTPEETVVIEDSRAGLTSAIASGATVICRKENRFEIDQSGADFYIDDLLEIEDIVNNL